MKKLILSSLVILFLVGLISASNPLPHAFYGNVEYTNGTLVENGKITANINGVEVGNSEIVNGAYDLVAESDNELETIYFYFDGLDASIETFLFESFEITELNFVIEVSSESGGDSHGGSNNDDSSTSNNDDDDSSSSPSSSKTPIQTTSNDNLNSEDAEISSNENQKTTSPGITGGVIGFAKTGKGIGLIFGLLIIVLGIEIITISRKKLKKKEEN